MRRPRTAPGVAEWLLAFACSGLIALQTTQRFAQARLQSSTAYYFETAWAAGFHLAGTAISGAILATIFAWIVIGRAWFRPVPAVLCGLGALVAWAEIAYALDVAQGAHYNLLGLPQYPINNVGTIGAQVFCTYLIFKLPRGRLSPAAGAAIKLAFAICFWFAQGFAFSALRMAYGSA